MFCFVIVLVFVLFINFCNLRSFYPRTGSSAVWIRSLSPWLCEKKWKTCPLFHSNQTSVQSSVVGNTGKLFAISLLAFLSPTMQSKYQQQKPFIHKALENFFKQQKCLAHISYPSPHISLALVFLISDWTFLTNSKLCEKKIEVLETKVFHSFTCFSRHKTALSKTFSCLLKRRQSLRRSTIVRLPNNQARSH